MVILGNLVEMLNKIMNKKIETSNDFIKEYFKNFFSIIFNNNKHLTALILAIFSGLVMVGPQIIFMWSLGDDYEGLYMMKSDAETHYLSRMQEFYDGNGTGNAYYLEDKNSFPNIFFGLSESMLSFPGYLMNITVPNLNLIYKLFLPIISFVLIYFFCLRLTGKIIWSLVGASLIIMGNILTSIPDILNLIKFDTVYSQFSIFSRPVNPQLSSILFFSYLNLLFYAVKTNKKIWYLFSLMLFSLSFYTYFYSWTFILCLNVSLAIVLFFNKDFKNEFWNIILVTTGGILIGLRTVVEILSVKFHPFSKDLNGIYDIVSHTPILSMAGLLVAVIFLVYLFKEKTYEKEEYFLMGMLLASFVAVNQQVISGISIQTGHYHWYFNVPIFIIIIMYLASKKIDIYFQNKHVNYIGVLVIVVCIYSSLFVQYSSYINNKDEAHGKQDYAMVFKWLRENTVKNSVVLADESMSELLPVYTSNNVVENLYGGLYLLDPNRRAYTRDNAINDMANNKVPKYKIDYIVWNKSKNPNWMVDKFKGVKQVDILGDYYIYQAIH